MVRNHVAPLLITCVVLICGLLPAHLHAEDPLATLQDHAITDSDSAAAAKGAGTGAAGQHHPGIGQGFFRLREAVTEEGFTIGHTRTPSRAMALTMGDDR